MPGTSGRLLTLLSLLQARRDWPGPLLAERLQVSDRTVRRDVDRLRELGYPIRTTKGPDGGYRLEAGVELPPLLFDDEQAVALAVALRLATTSGAAVADGAARALATVRQVLPSRLRHRVDALEVTAVPAPGDTRVDADLLVALTGAIRTHDVVRFDYASPGTTPADLPPRRVEPRHVVARAGRWYLLGWDLDRDDWRTFRLDRMTLRLPGGPRFVPRPLPGHGDPATYLRRRFRGTDRTTGGDKTNDSTDDWPCRGEVVLHLPAAQVVPFALDGTVVPLDGQRTRLVLGSWSWAGLVALLLRFDADIEVVGPPALRDAVDRSAARLSRAAAAGTVSSG